MTNAWKNNKNTQDTKSTSNEVRGQATFRPNTIPVVDMQPTQKLPATKLVIDATKVA